VDPELLPVLPEDLASLSNEELSEILEAARTVAADIHSRDEETLSKITDVSLVDAMTKAVEVVETCKAELTAREEALEAENAALAELAAKVIEPEAEEEEPEGDPKQPVEQPVEPPAVQPAQPAEGEEDDEEEKFEPPDGRTVVEDGDTAPLPVAAAGAPKETVVRSVSSRVTPRSAPRVPASHRPRANSSRGKAVIVASAESGMPEGKEVTTLDIAQAMKRRRENFGRIGKGVSEKVTIATITASYPEERTLDGTIDDQDKITEAVGGAPGTKQQVKALTASGGLCAPVQPYYDLQTLAQADRPVRDALVGFNATRGGIRYAPPASLGSIITTGASGAAVGRITAAQDASGTNKSCQHITCPTFQEVDVAAIYHCLSFGNLGARAWPEQVANFTQLAMAAWARTAEIALLDGIESASTKVTAAQAAGANSTLMGQVLEAAAAMRNRHRMDPEATLRLLMPAWGLDLLLADSLRTAFPRYPQDDAGITALFRSFGVAITFFWDASSTSGNLFGGQTTGIALNGFPPTIDWYLYPEGSFLFVDSGQLELGIVRDSTLNNTNDYQVFGESWENVAFIGVESLRVRSSVCDTGGTGAATTISCGSA